MKNEALLALALALLGGCATSSRPAAPAARALDVRGAADDIRVDHGYRPGPTGSESVSVAFDHPARAYYAHGWGGWDACAPVRWCRPAYRRCN